MKKWWLLLLLVGFHPCLKAQFSRYVISLKDKAGTPFSLQQPAAFLSSRALERRTRYQVPIQSNDLPINPVYVDSIRQAGDVRILSSSKWFNQVCIETSDAAALKKINGYSFVVRSAPIAPRPAVRTPSNKYQATTALNPATARLRPQNRQNVYNYGNASAQTDLHNASFLHNLGFAGQGIQVALMDAGFLNYTTSPAFDSVRNNGQIVGTWDFVNNESSVNEDDAHGVYCLSTMAANLSGTFVGTAPKSSYLLYRTEDVLSEYPMEEHFWVAAAEKADSTGADVLSVSLGYTTFDNPIFNYTYAMLDGGTTTIARACNVAAAKGMLVVAAMGNEGTSSWKYLTTPADADSVFTVGAVGANRLSAPFSSYGPNASGLVKPDVAAIGQGAVVANPFTGLPFAINGTSFACPIMAGMAGCLWQAFPEVNNRTLINAIRSSGDRASQPDDRTGYGIPDIKKAFVLLLQQSMHSEISINNCSAVIRFSVKAAAGMNMMVERKLSFQNDYVPVNTIAFQGRFARGDYSFNDDLSLITGGTSVSYRLKMTIGTDTSFYLNNFPENLPLSCNTPFSQITVHPNPVRSEVWVRLPANGFSATAITLHDATGRMVYQTKNLSPGGTSFRIPMNQLPAGLYIVTIWSNDKKLLVKELTRQ